jgi:mannose-6-phosphate isomerase-like protein (cupin superfamily)
MIRHKSNKDIWRKFYGYSLVVKYTIRFFIFSFPVIALLFNGCKDGAKALENEPSVTVMQSEDGDLMWVFPKSKDTLGSGGELQIYIDHKNHPDAAASFAKYTMGIGGQLPVHRHDKTEEIAYILSGEGVVISFRNEQPMETPIGSGCVWYTPPGAWHSFKNTGNESLSLVFAAIPNEKKGLLSFFRKIAVEPGKESKTHLSPEEFGKIAAEHDLILKPSTNTSEQKK